MKVKLLFLDNRNREATKVVNLPEGLSPCLGMTIYTENDICLEVKTVEVDIDITEPCEAQTVLILKDTYIESSACDNPESAASVIFEGLAEAGWHLNFVH
jgi:hypothetical protein